MEQEIRDLIDRVGFCNDMCGKYTKEYLIFKDLFAYHPSNKAKNMVNLKIVKSIYNDYQLKIVNDDCTEATISWKDCIKIKKGKSVKVGKNFDLIKAMRNIISDQIIEFKKHFKYNFKCSFCSLEGNNSRDFIVKQMKMANQS